MDRLRTALERLALGDLSGRAQAPSAFEPLLARICERWLAERKATILEVIAAIAQSRSLHELEQARLAELEAAHEQLKRTQERMVANSKLAALGTLAAGVAHELNQPLTAIVALVDLLRDCPRDAVGDHLDSIERILAAAERLASIVDNVRTFGRQDAFTLESTVPREPVERAAELLREGFRVDGIQLEIRDLLPGDMRIRADSTRFQQIFINLLANARDALLEVPAQRDGRAEVEIVTSDGCVEFRVSDNGPGIPDGLADRIFDPFFTTKGPGRGTGLGLSVSRAILEEHGGSLEYQRDPRRTTFLCRVPVNTTAR